MYRWATWCSFGSMSSKWRVRKMPLPCESASGLRMNVFAFFQLNYALNSFSSAGSSHVGGKNAYSFGWYFDIFIRFFPRLFLRASVYIPAGVNSSARTGEVVSSLVRAHAYKQRCANPEVVPDNVVLHVVVLYQSEVEFALCDLFHDVVAEIGNVHCQAAALFSLGRALWVALLRARRLLGRWRLLLLVYL